MDANYPVNKSIAVWFKVPLFYFECFFIQGICVLFRNFGTINQ